MLAIHLSLRLARIRRTIDVGKLYVFSLPTDSQSNCLAVVHWHPALEIIAVPLPSLAATDAADEDLTHLIYPDSCRANLVEVCSGLVSSALPVHGARHPRI